MKNQTDQQSSQDQIYDNVVRFILILLSVIALIAGIWRMFAANEISLKRLDGTTLLFFGVAGALLLLRDVKSFAFGDYKLELFERVQKIEDKADKAQDKAEEAQNKAENAQNKAENAQNNADDAKSLAIGQGGNSLSENVFSETVKTIVEGPNKNDPWKGQFGTDTANNRKITAQVSTIPGSSHVFSIELKVFSTLSEQDPLKGVVQFYLHPTFRNDRPIITVGPDGVAEMKLRAWGAFTVGALADEGKTKLELDLSELENAPADFRVR